MTKGIWSSKNTLQLLFIFIAIVLQKIMGGLEGLLTGIAIILWALLYVWHELIREENKLRHKSTKK